MDINFESSPFTGFAGYTNEELGFIWMYLYEKNSKLPEYIIVSKQNETDKGTIIIASKNENLKSMEILCNGVDIFKDGSLFAKIYSVQQLDLIISMIIDNDKYDFKINGNKIDKNSVFGVSKIFRIDIESKKDLEYENFQKYITRERNTLFEEDETIIEEEVIELEKLRLSPYFNKLIKEPQTDEHFKFIINENRLTLIRKINEFWVSDDLFYVIMGTDGIGKSTTLLYFINFVHNYNVLYLNLKLIHDKTKQEVEDIFFNEMKRIYFVSKNFVFDYTLEEKYKNFKNLKSAILQDIENNNLNKNIKGIKYMWLLLKTFLKTLKFKEIYNSNLLIILDQYKCNKIDIDYEELNNISVFIEKNKKSSYFYKYKLLVIISINNYDTKIMFLENLNITFFDYKNELVPDNNCIKKKLEDNKNYELLNIEKFLDEKIEKINKSFNERILKNESRSNSDSLCFLNTRYCKLTRKEYLNFNSNCKKLIPENIEKNYRYCIKAFNYSLKYYHLFMILKSENEKKEEEKDDEYEKRIVKLFYSKMYIRIRDNIVKSFKYILKKESSLELIQLILKYLIMLRNYIYEERTFLIDEIEDKLHYFPVKYLNVFLSYIEEFNKNQIDFELYNFFFTYSNIFIQHSINKIIDDYSKNTKYKYFDGINFEKIVNEKISQITIHNKKLIKRNIFSLVGISKSTKSYVNKLREKENIEFYEFYGLNRLQKIFIDGVDETEIKKSIIDVTKNDIFLNQVSKNGRSFDAGLLIKKDTTNKLFTSDLILFQDTINKIINCKKKEIYINDSINSKNYLESVYEGLKIDKIYFIFIIPAKYIYAEDTINKLKFYQIYYIYYSLEKKLFLNPQNNIITDFRIKEADISFPEKNFSLIKTLSEINLSKYIIEESAKQYLVKRKNTKKTFIEIYNKMCKINFYECINIFIPIKLKNNLIKLFISEKYIKDGDIINFIPSSNYKGEEVESIFKITNNMIIFSYNKEIYLYYYSCYLINDDFEIKKTNNFVIDKSNNLDDVKSPNKDIDEFKEIKNYPLFHFCFNVIKNHKFSEDNYVNK